MTNLAIDKDFFDVEEIEAEEEEEELTLWELQELVKDLLERVAKLERHQAKF